MISDDPPRPHPRAFRPGGMFRCCVESLQTMPDSVYDDEGNETTCIHCGAKLRYKHDAWEWAGLKDAPK